MKTTPAAWMKYAKNLVSMDVAAEIRELSTKSDDYLERVAKTMKSNAEVLSSANAEAGEILRNPVSPMIADLCSILGIEPPTPSARAMMAAGDCRWFDFSKAIEVANRIRRAAIDEMNRRCGL